VRKKKKSRKRTERVIEEVGDMDDPTQ